MTWAYLLHEPGLLLHLRKACGVQSLCKAQLLAALRLEQLLLHLLLQRQMLQLLRRGAYVGGHAHKPFVRRRLAMPRERPLHLRHALELLLQF